MGAAERIEGELAAGRLWKARDRVTGAVGAAPTDQVLLDLAGRVFTAMGDLPRAGTYWYLTERSGPEVEAATAAMQERYPSSMALADALPRRAANPMFPPGVTERLDALDAAVAAEHRGMSVTWSRGRLTPRPVARPASRASGLGFVVFLGMLVFLVLYGLVSCASDLGG